MMASIDSILYDLNHLELHKPVKIIIDSESVFNCLTESVADIEIIDQKEEVFDLILFCFIY